MSQMIDSVICNNGLIRDLGLVELLLFLLVIRTYAHLGTPSSVGSVTFKKVTHYIIVTSPTKVTHYHYSYSRKKK